MLIRALAGERSAPFYIEDIGYLMPVEFKATLVEFDDSTPYLKEMRRRAETPEDSISLEELRHDARSAAEALEQARSAPKTRRRG